MGDNKPYFPHTYQATEPQEELQETVEPETTKEGLFVGAVWVDVDDDEVTRTIQALTDTGVHYYWFKVGQDLCNLLFYWGVSMLIKESRFVTSLKEALEATPEDLHDMIRKGYADNQQQEESVEENKQGRLDDLEQRVKAQDEGQRQQDILVDALAMEATTRRQIPDTKRDLYYIKGPVKGDDRTIERHGKEIAKNKEQLAQVVEAISAESQLRETGEATAKTRLDRQFEMIERLQEQARASTNFECDFNNRLIAIEGIMEPPSPLVFNIRSGDRGTKSTDVCQNAVKEENSSGQMWYDWNCGSSSDPCKHIWHGYCPSYKPIPQKSHVNPLDLGRFDQMEDCISELQKARDEGQRQQDILVDALAMEATKRRQSDEKITQLVNINGCQISDIKRDVDRVKALDERVEENHYFAVNHIASLRANIQDLQEQLDRLTEDREVACEDRATIAQLVNQRLDELEAIVHQGKPSSSCPMIPPEQVQQQEIPLFPGSVWEPKPDRWGNLGRVKIVLGFDEDGDLILSTAKPGFEETREFDYDSVGYLLKKSTFVVDTDKAISLAPDHLQRLVEDGYSCCIDPDLYQDEKSQPHEEPTNDDEPIDYYPSETPEEETDLVPVDEPHKGLLFKYQGSEFSLFDLPWKGLFWLLAGIALLLLSGAGALSLLTWQGIL